MRTPANIAKHPIHPMLVAIPIGLWVFSLVCDLVHLGGKIALRDPALLLRQKKRRDINADISPIVSTALAVAQLAIQSAHGNDTRRSLCAATGRSVS